MYLLFNDLIYPLFAKREGLYRRSVQPHYHFLGGFTNTKLIHMLELFKHFSDIFYPSCLYNRFLDLLKRIIQIDSRREIVLEETPSFPARYS